MEPQKVIIVNSQGIPETPEPSNGEAIVASDTVDLVNPGKLYVHVSGDLTVHMKGNGGVITFTDFSGWLPVIVKRVLSTGLTASEIYVFW